MINVGRRGRGRVKLFGIYGSRRSPMVPHRWALCWGYVTEDDAAHDESLDYGESVWDRFCVWIGRDGKSTISLWRGPRRPFTG